MQKSKPIITLISKLQLATRDWIISDDWQADLMAIGVAHRRDPATRVYISMALQAKGRYYYECESSDPTGVVPYVAGPRGTCVPFPELLAAMQEHLQ
jgi:hypothetical protein